MKKWNEKLFNDLEEIKQEDDYNDLVKALEALDPSKIRFQDINHLCYSDLSYIVLILFSKLTAENKVKIIKYKKELNKAKEALDEEFNAKVNKLLDE